MLLHFESAVTESIRNPSARRVRIARLRSECGYSRFVGLAGVGAAALLAASQVSSPSPIVFLGAGLFFLYLSGLAQSQLHLFLAVDQFEELIARHRAGGTEGVGK